MVQTSNETNGLTKYLYSVAETAFLLSVCRNTVYQLIETGKLLAVYPTSHARISAESIRRFLSQLEDEARSNRESLKRLRGSP